MAVNKFDNLAFPLIGPAQDIKGEGLSKRELFSVLFMQAFLTQEGNENRMFSLAHAAVDNADALIEVLQHRV